MIFRIKAEIAGGLGKPCIHGENGERGNFAPGEKGIACHWQILEVYSLMRDQQSWFVRNQSAHREERERGHPGHEEQRQDRENAHKNLYCYHQ